MRKAGALLVFAISSCRSCVPDDFLSDCTGSPCVNGTCQCDPGFTGTNCATAQLGSGAVAFYEKQDWVWGTSVLTDAAGAHHAFTMELKNRCGVQHYRHNGRIIHGTASNVLGPFTRRGVALDARPGFFDGVEVEDPAIVRLPNDKGYLLYYTGAAYANQSSLNCSQGDQPDTAHGPLGAAQRIGVAFSPSLDAPWQRLPEPILRPRAGKWDSERVCNPAPLILPNGTVLLVYRATSLTGRQGGLGVASAPDWRGPYTALTDAPLFDGYAEDAALFLGPSGVIHLIAHGEIRGLGVGVHAASVDGVAWGRADTAYTLYVDWATNRTQSASHEALRLGRRERPQILIGADGRPSALYNSAMGCKCAYGNRSPQCLWGDACRSYSMAVPFAYSESATT